jgi:ubiquitin carboxyl-terminal hydrolase L5
MIDVDINLADLASKKTRSSSAGDYDDDDESWEEAFHFIAYVHVGDALWELDGLKRQPVKLRMCSSPWRRYKKLTLFVETCAKKDWLSLVSPSLQERISRYSEGELRFNLLAVVPERLGGIAEATGEGSYEDIAQRRKFDYEGFIHKVAMMLTKEQLVSAGLVYN